MSPDIFQNHHKVEKRSGGSDDPENIERVTRVKHALIHFERFLSFQGTEAEFEYDATFGQVEEMSQDEKERFFKEVEKRYKVKIKFI